MNAPTVDTCTAAKRLRDAGFDVSQPEAAVTMGRDAIGSDRDALAAKSDLATLEARMDAKLEALEGRMYRALWIQGGGDHRHPRRLEAPGVAQRMASTTFKLLAAAFAVSVLAFSAVAYDALRDPYAHFFQDTFGDFTEELDVAREDGKKGIVIFFEMDECPFCERMRETVLNRADVQDYYRERFRIFTVDIEGDTEVVDFAGHEMPAKDFAFKVNKVRATPVIAFYDLDGRRVVRFTGAVRDKQEFLWLGEFAADGYYRTTNFTRFKRAKRAAASGSATQ